MPGFHGRVWIDGSEGTFLGYGRIVLLERIRQYGSITQAAKSMEMSYRHAWELVDSMNRQARKPLVETASGGNHQHSLGALALGAMDAARRANPGKQTDQTKHPAHYNFAWAVFGREKVGWSHGAGNFTNILRRKSITRDYANRADIFSFEC